MILDGLNAAPLDLNAISSVALLRVCDPRREIGVATRDSDTTFRPIYPSVSFGPHAIQRGDNLTFVSSAFGLVSPRIFANALSRGIVSNWVDESFLKRRDQRNSSKICSFSNDCGSPSVGMKDRKRGGGRITGDILRACESSGHSAHKSDNSREQDVRNSASAVLILSDARMLPGSEGGPVVFSDTRRLAGIVLPPLIVRSDAQNDTQGAERGGKSPIEDHRQRNEKTDGTEQGPVLSRERLLPLSLIVPMERILEFLPGPLHQLFDARTKKRQTALEISKTGLVPSSSVSMLKAVAATTALICVGYSWGSGVLVSHGGYVLTCAHLLTPFLPKTIVQVPCSLSATNKDVGTSRMRSLEGYFDLTCCPTILVRLCLPPDSNEGNADRDRYVWRKAQAVYVSPGSIDVAVLQLMFSPPLVASSQERTRLLPERGILTRTLRPIELCAESSLPCPGDPIFALGHKVFQPDFKAARLAVTGAVPQHSRIFKTTALSFAGRNTCLLKGEERGRRKNGEAPSSELGCSYLSRKRPADMRASVSKGIVAKNVHVHLTFADFPSPRRPQPLPPAERERSTKEEIGMVQTSSLILSGDSGGALIDAKGCFVGLITSNAMHADGAIIPFLNFSVSVSLLRRLIEGLRGDSLIDVAPSPTSIVAPSSSTSPPPSLSSCPSSSPPPSSNISASTGKPTPKPFAWLPTLSRDQLVDGLALASRLQGCDDGAATQPTSSNLSSMRRKSANKETSSRGLAVSIALVIGSLLPVDDQEMRKLWNLDFDDDGGEHRGSGQEEKVDERRAGNEETKIRSRL